MRIVLPVPRLLLLSLLLCQVSFAGAESPVELLQRFNDYPHATSVNAGSEAVVDYEVGLGAMQKIRGAWRFKDSERLSGQRTYYTWQITDGFTANEVLAEIEADLESEVLIFSCDGRSCGQGVQWANRVFRERVLYGRDELQRYRLYGPADDSMSDYRLLLFSTARTADRQYLHVELVELLELAE